MDEVKLLVLMSTHNRQEELTSCLTALCKSISIANVVVSLSNSGKAVNIPGDLSIDVIVKKVPTNAFWAEAMFSASSLYERDSTFTHVLWLNDDVTLSPNSVDKLIRLMRSTGADIVVGQTSSKEGELTYGGFLRDSVLKPLHFRRVIARELPLKVDTFNGNIVLLGHKALTQIGPFLPGYKHYLADIAYGLNATRKGLRAIVAPGFFGVCRANDAVNPSLDKRVSRKERLVHLISPQGLPFTQHFRYSLSYGGALGIIYFASTYLRFLWALFTYEKSQPDVNLDK